MTLHRERVSWTLENIAKAKALEINEYSHIAIVQFDDEVTSVEKIVTRWKKRASPWGGRQTPE